MWNNNYVCSLSLSDLYKLHDFYDQIKPNHPNYQEARMRQRAISNAIQNRLQAIDEKVFGWEIYGKMPDPESRKMHF